MLRSMNLLGHNLFAIAAIVCAVLFVHAARAEEGMYSTVDEESVTVTDGATGDSTTTTTTSSESMPESMTDHISVPFNTRDSRRFSTSGRTVVENTSDIDQPRFGFDDPRNPWDGRYSNDNPANHPSNAVDDARDASGANRKAYAPGAYRNNMVGGNNGD